MRFILGEDIEQIPVGPVAGEVIHLDELPEHPLFHGIFVSKAQKEKALFAYVVLFHAFEFLVLLDEISDLTDYLSGYLQNIVTGLREVRRFRWLKSEADLLPWIGRREFVEDRFNTRTQPLSFWLKDRNALWLQRGTGAGVQRYIDVTNRGGTETVAKAEATKEVQRVLSEYGFTLTKLHINLGQWQRWSTIESGGTVRYWLQSKGWPG